MNARRKSTGAVGILTQQVLQWFVNREDILRSFREKLEAHARQSTFILVVEGPEGIGKSWLLEKLRSEAHQKKRLRTAALDLALDEANDHLDIVSHLARRLGSDRFPALNTALEEATERKFVIKFEAPERSGGITIEGDVGDHAQIAMGNIIQDNVFNINADKVVDPKIQELLFKNLNTAFFNDLARLSRQQTILLLFDNCEHATANALAWISTQLLARMKQGELPNLWLAMAGEELPEIPSDFQGVLIKRSLDPLPAKEVRTYLKEKRQIAISEEQIAALYDITHGRPNLVGLMAVHPERWLEAGTSEPEKLQEIMVTQLMEEVSPPLLMVFRLAALVGWTDLEMVQALSDQPADAAEVLPDLATYPFIVDDELGRYRFSSERICQIALEACAKKAVLTNAFRTRVAEYLETRAAAELDTVDAMQLKRLAARHWLAVDERKGLSRLRELFDQDEIHYNTAQCQRLLDEAGAIKTLSGAVKNWLAYLQARLDFLRRNLPASRAALDRLLDSRELDPELRAFVLWTSGEVDTEAGRWEAATRALKDSRSFFVGFGNERCAAQVTLSLGDAYLQQAQILGGPVDPGPGRTGQPAGLRHLPSLVASLPFIAYAKLVRQWRLPPLQYSVDYANWSMMHLLLSAVAEYERAIAAFQASSQAGLTAFADMELARAYHLLGWRRDARQLFKDRILSSSPVVTNEYMRARALQVYGAILLDEDEIDAACQQLNTALAIYERFGDVHGQAAVKRLLGQANMHTGAVEEGLGLFKDSLELLAPTGDRFDVGMTLNAIWLSLENERLSPEEKTRAAALTGQVPEKTYFQRIPDRASSILETGITAGLILMALLGVILFAAAFGANLASTPDFLSSFFSGGSLLRLAGWALGISWAFVTLLSLVGFAIVSKRGEVNLKTEGLNNITTGEAAITHSDYRDRPLANGTLPWDDVQGLLELDCFLWRDPIRIFSSFRLLGRGGQKIHVPATIRWYSTLKQDVARHLEQRQAKPARLPLNLHVFWSWQGLALALSPLLLGLGSALIYNWVDIPLTAGAAAAVGPLLLIAGSIAMMCGPYWWFVLYPMWRAYWLAPRSRLLPAAAALGVVLVGMAFYLQNLQPYFPIRSMLDRAVFPLGFLLALLAPLWVITARSWPAPEPGGPGFIYSIRQRGLAMLVLLAAVLATGSYSASVWYPDVAYNFQAISLFYDQEYQPAIERFSEMIERKTNLQNSYYYRGRAYLALEEWQHAASDFSQLIDSGQDSAGYYIYRASAYHGAGQQDLACTDLNVGLNSSRWPLSREERERIKQAYWVPWGCGR